MDEVGVLDEVRVFDEIGVSDAVGVLDEVGKFFTGTDSQSPTDLILRSPRSGRLEGWMYGTDSWPSFETRPSAS
jgi:hypothetical protein